MADNLKAMGTAREGVFIEPGQIPGIEFIKPTKKAKKEPEERPQTEQARTNAMPIANPVVPPILYLANKSEDGYEGEILADFYRKFPQITTAIDPTTGEPYDPIFVSAEHGDGLPDLF